MQRIRNIDYIIKKVKKNIEIKHINPIIKDNSDKLFFWKSYFINLWGSIEGLESDKIKNFFESKSQVILNLKKYFLLYLQKNWILTCVYCWKVSNIHWELSEKLVKLYDIEHFLPRSRYPYLAVNLYNWLPVCKACNETLKKNIDPLEWTNKNKRVFHPYFWWIYKDWDKIKVDDSIFDEKVTFVWTPNLDYDSRTQIFSTYHWKFFKLWEIYLYDEETYNIFNFIYDKYTKIKDEYCRFKKTSKSIKEFVDYFFKNYYPEKEEEILKYSNWKLKKDLIEYMEKILEDELDEWNLCWKEKRFVKNNEI